MNLNKNLQSLTEEFEMINEKFYEFDSNRDYLKAQIIEDHIFENFMNLNEENSSGEIKNLEKLLDFTIQQSKYWKDYISEYDDITFPNFEENLNSINTKFSKLKTEVKTTLLFDFSNEFQ